MTRYPTTVGELIALWPSAEQFARDLKLKHTSHARLMRMRGSIAPRWWDDVVLAASRRGIEGVNHGTLERIYASTRRAPRAYGGHAITAAATCAHAAPPAEQGAAA